MSITLEAIPLPEIGVVELNIQQTVNIKVSAAAARRRDSRYVGEQIGNLLYGENPTLLLKKARAYWHVPVTLGSASLGRIGQVGAIEVDVETGEICLNEATTQEITTNAQRLAAWAEYDEVGIVIQD